MNCQKAENYMMKYMDGEITAKESAQLGAHIENCEVCYESFKTYDVIKSEFDMNITECEYPAPEGFVEAVAGKIALLPERKKAVSSFENLVFIVWGVFSIIFGAGFLLFLNREQIVALMEGNEVFTSYLRFIEPFGVKIEELTVAVQTVMTDALSSAGEFFNSYRYVVLAVFFAAVIVQYAIRLRKKKEKAE